MKSIISFRFLSPPIEITICFNVKTIQYYITYQNVNILMWRVYLLKIESNSCVCCSVLPSLCNDTYHATHCLKRLYDTLLIQGLKCNKLRVSLKWSALYCFLYLVPKHSRALTYTYSRAFDVIPISELSIHSYSRVFNAIHFQELSIQNLFMSF